jgi:hypothetical protein
MRVLTVFIFLLCSSFMNAQNSKTTIKDMGKVGNMSFVVATSDTATMVGVMQSNILGLHMVSIPGAELAEVIQVLNTYSEEVAKKSTEQSVIQNRTASLLLHCSYFKNAGWTIMIQNMDPALEKTAEVAQRKTGYVQFYYIEIKPKQIKDVVKMFTKALK